MTDTANLLGFLGYYLAENAAINAACKGAIAPQEKGLDVDALLLSTNNATETCIILDQIYRGSKSTNGGFWSGLVRFNTTLTITVITLQGKTVARSLGDLIEHLLVNGIPYTIYDGLGYSLSTVGQEMGRKFLDDPESQQSREILTMRGSGYYRK
jgi:hypothetical protein